MESNKKQHLKIGKIFYDKEDYQRAINCFKKYLAEYNAAPNYYEVGDAAHAAMKAYKLEAGCRLLELLYDCYIYLGMTSEAKSYEKKISKLVLPSNNRMNL